MGQKTLTYAIVPPANQCGRTFRNHQIRYDLRQLTLTFLPQVWFQNRRAKFRKEGRRRTNNIAAAAAAAARRSTTVICPHGPPINNATPPAAQPTTANSPQLEITTMNNFLLHQRRAFTVEHLQAASKETEVKELADKNKMEFKDHAEQDFEQRRRDEIQFLMQKQLSEDYHNRYAITRREIEARSRNECCCINCRLGTCYAKY